MILKTKLKEILNEREMTQKELSELTGLRPNAISEIAKNTRDSINREHIGKIATALNIDDPNDILYFEKQ
jgi:DNA-binding Xre family transcriptional regulator